MAGWDRTGESYTGAGPSLQFLGAAPPGLCQSCLLRCGKALTTSGCHCHRSQAESLFRAHLPGRVLSLERAGRGHESPASPPLKVTQKRLGGLQGQSAGQSLPILGGHPNLLGSKDRTHMSTSKAMAVKHRCVMPACGLVLVGATGRTLGLQCGDNGGIFQGWVLLGGCCCSLPVSLPAFFSGGKCWGCDATCQETLPRVRLMSAAGPCASRIVN